MPQLVDGKISQFFPILLQCCSQLHVNRISNRCLKWLKWRTMIHLSGRDTSYTPIPQGENLLKGCDDLIHFKKGRLWKTAFSFLYYESKSLCAYCSLISRGQSKQCGNDLDKPSDANVCRALRHHTPPSEAVLKNSVLPAVLFLAWSIRRATRQEWLLGKFPPGIPRITYWDPS